MTAADPEPPPSGCPDCRRPAAPGEDRCAGCGKLLGPRPDEPEESPGAPLADPFPGEAKVAIGCLGFYGGLGVLFLILTISALVSAGEIPEKYEHDFFALWVFPTIWWSFSVCACGLLIHGLCRRTRWGWWGAEGLFGSLMGYGALFLFASLLTSLREHGASHDLGDLGWVIGMALMGGWAIPFWLLLSCRSHFMNQKRT